MAAPVRQGTAKKPAKKPAKSWEELYARTLRDLKIHQGFRSGGD